jgi:hypothetical protein
MDAKFERPMRAVSASGGMRWGNSMTEGGSELDGDVFESEESVTGAETGRGWKVEGESPHREIGEELVNPGGVDNVSAYCCLWISL